jgi:glycosyltransferase involved in cell wall biosynthesis
MPKVSVIIPAYNAMKYLPQTVESALLQTLTDIEIVIVNDGSSDGIVEWASQITDPRVKFISQPNQGTATARNTGITQSKGEYIAFLDADDIWEPTKLEKQAQCLDNNPLVGLVDAWAAFIDEDGKPTGYVMKPTTEGDVFRQIVEACESTVCCGSSPMIRRSCFDNIGLFDRDSYIEDIDMWLRIARHYHYGVVKEPLLRYRLHDSNKSKDCESMLRGFRQLIEKTYQSLPTEVLYLRARTYGRLYVFLAGRAIENQDPNLAIYYLKQATRQYPQLLFRRWFLRLSLAATILKWLGPQGYNSIRGLNRALRRSMSSRRNTVLASQ